MIEANGGADAMSLSKETTPKTNGGAENTPSDKPTTPKTYPPELQALLEKASQGDLTVLPEVKKAFDDHPELAEQLGDLVRHAQDSLLTLVAGSCLTAREAIARQASALRERLLKTATSELEKLLVDRVVISWIEVYHGDIDLANQLLHVSGASKTAQAAQRRLDRAHARYLSAIKALATTHKLLRPALSPLELAFKFVPEEKAGTAGLRPAVDPAEGVPVLN
jgi:hypothetical protein